MSYELDKFSIRYVVFVSALLIIGFTSFGASADVKCRNFIDHELGRAAPQSTYTKAGPCFSRTSEKLDGKETELFMVAVKKPKCERAGPGYGLPDWGNYSAYATRIGEYEKGMVVTTYFTLGASMSDELFKPFDSVDGPSLTYHLSSDCKIDHVMAQNTRLDFKTCASLPELDLSSNPRELERERVFMTAKATCTMLTKDYASFFVAIPGQRSRLGGQPPGTRP